MLPLLLVLLTLCSISEAISGAAQPWTRIGPWNIFDDKDGKGESGTLACAASPRDSPHIIYAGGQNNGVSSGILKTVDGGKHWMRKSHGLWDTRILGVWLDPDDALGLHVYAGTHSGIYESVNGGESWEAQNETVSWGNVMSFRQGVIDGVPYLLANSQHGILTKQLTGSWGHAPWRRIASPGGIAANAHLSIVTPAGRNTEVLTCIGSWAGGKLYYAKLHNASNATWQGPIATADQHIPHWQ